MSRIDKAMRAWENSSGIARRDEHDIPRSTRTTLSDYAAETERAREVTPAGPLAAAVAVAMPPPIAVAPPTPPPIAAAPPTPAPVQAPTSPPLPPPTARDRTPVAPATVPVAKPARIALDRDADARLVPTSANVVSLEQYRRLAATLHDIQQRNGLKTVMVTSAAPHEGKTLTTVNLAYTLTESYARRVLVIDADLRRPSLHALLKVANRRGLSEVLTEQSLDLPVTDVAPGLSLITAGRPATPLAGLSSPRMRGVLEDCERRFDWVFVDTPPVGVLPDAQLLARLTGGVLLVIAAGITPAALVARAVAEIGEECIIGTVLNRVDTHIISEADYLNRYHETNVESAT